MRGRDKMMNEYDMVEDIRVVKTSKIFNRKFLIGAIAVMMFISSCGLFFKTTYLYAFHQIELKEQEEDQLAQNKNNSSRKTYYIEQRIRKDLEKMQQQSN